MQVLSLGQESPGVGHGNPLQYPCLGKPIDRGARGATVHGVKKSWTRVSALCARAHARAHTHTHTHTANSQQFLHLFPLASLLERRVIDSISSQLT